MQNSHESMKYYYYIETQQKNKLLTNWVLTKLLGTNEFIFSYWKSVKKLRLRKKDCIRSNSIEQLHLDIEKRRQNFWGQVENPWESSPIQVRSPKMFVVFEREIPYSQRRPQETPQFPQWDSLKMYTQIQLWTQTKQTQKEKAPHLRGSTITFF